MRTTLAVAARLAALLLSFSGCGSSGVSGRSDATADASDPLAGKGSCAVMPDPATVAQDYVVHGAGLPALATVQLTIRDTAGPRVVTAQTDASGTLSLTAQSTAPGSATVTIATQRGGSGYRTAAQCGFSVVSAVACGDGTCNGTETCSTCPADCGACGPSCGDGACNAAETCSTCATDCGTCGATFYVSPSGSDSNPGTSTAPWRTLQHAASTLVAGQTAIIMDGTYTEGSITFANDGIAGQPITLRAQNRWAAVLASTSSCLPAIYILKSYITIDGLKFTVSANNVPCGNPTGNSWNAALWCYNASGTLPSVASPSTPTSHCVVQNNFVEASSQRDVGFKWVQDYAIFDNNVVYGSIEGFNNFGSIVRHNTVYQGDHWSAYMYFKGGVRSLQAYDNLIVMNAGQSGGLILGGSSGSAWFDTASHVEAYGSVAFNNVVLVQGGGSATNTPALGLMGAVDSAIYNNVVVGGQVFSTVGSANGYDPRPPSSNPAFKNNIVSCLGGAATFSGMWSYSGALALDYNDFFDCTGAPSQAHGVVGDPLFADSSADWHLKPTSPALAAGAPLTFVGYAGEAIDVSTAKDGTQRGSGPWDLGIYGTSSTPTLQLAAVSPASGAGSTQMFALTVVDANGFSNVGDIDVMITGNGTGGANTCWLHYFQPSRSLQLSNDSTPVDPWQPLVALGASTVEQNSQCSISFAGASAVGSGTMLTLSLPITFAAGWSGAKTIYVYAADQRGVSVGYAPAGSWTVP